MMSNIGNFCPQMINTGGVFHTHVVHRLDKSYDLSRNGIVVALSLRHVFVGEDL
jgi:hypothetical protein